MVTGQRGWGRGYGGEAWAAPASARVGEGNAAHPLPVVKLPTFSTLPRGSAEGSVPLALYCVRLCLRSFGSHHLQYKESPENLSFGDFLASLELPPLYSYSSRPSHFTAPLTGSETLLPLILLNSFLVCYNFFLWLLLLFVHLSESSLAVQGYVWYCTKVITHILMQTLKNGIS